MDEPSSAPPPGGRAEELVRLLDLAPHPEGGHYRETFRSTRTVVTVPEQERRAGLTTIYFLLRGGEKSRWHRLGAADEAWHFYEGAPLDLLWLDRAMRQCRRVSLDRFGPGGEPAAVVPAGCWQAARSTGDYTLVGCSVGPGFDFGDFAFLSDVPEEAAVVRARFEHLASLI